MRCATKNSLATVLVFVFVCSGVGVGLVGGGCS